MSTTPPPPRALGLLGRGDSLSSPLLRKGVPGERKPLKEKLITYYEQIFQGQDPSARRPQFWEEFFLLKVNVEYLSQIVAELTIQQLITLKETFNMLFVQCCRALQTDDNMIRNINAMQTLCALLHTVFQKKVQDMSFDVIDILIGFNSAECQMRNLIESLTKFLSEDYPVSVKNLSLRLLLIVLTATDNVNQNVLLEYVMMNSVFEAIMQVLSLPESREQHGYDSAAVLTVLVNYRKYEAANPYVIKLSVLDDEIALNGLGCVISAVLTEYNRQYSAPIDQPLGFFGHITSLVSNMLVPVEVPKRKVEISLPVLLALYEAVHLNRNFITILTHTRSASQPSTPTLPTPAVTKSLPVPSSPTEATTASVAGPLPPHLQQQPTNLLGTFLTFSSIVLQNTRDEESVRHGRLCLIILTCITEDQYANSFLHDTNMTFPVTLYKASLLHRKVRTQTPQSMPLACSLLDLMVEFMVSHLTKNFPVELYRKAIGITHRIICYQKRCKIRLAYNWKELWSALVNVVKFFATMEEQLLPHYDIFTVANDVVKIFNLFITYGDTFLPNPTTYDELYYELIRVHKVFDDLYALAVKHSTSESAAHKESAAKLETNLTNVRSIATHFTPKIDAWATAHQANPITPEQVLEVVRSNYDSLTLKLQDNLDHFDKYAEKLKESTFFTQLVRAVISEIKDTIALRNLQQMSVLTELSVSP